ncbi:acyl carrier protein [Sphingomonas sp. SORGH_AS_0879]|uniref:acyl carrier protein n=1 Tax=Sphingomonas sp. SORGH_AS_0879 TaxID=3041790 RepID=UPI00277DB6DD|nr:acyl carrier protein [Sphingomonas sp. SORGH_AS_0879]MDQ1228598.1 acyl carrier protein [Sphingomonas sp. SORGH_AS_0879]
MDGKTAVEEKINQAFKDAIGIDPAKSDVPLAYNETPGWDSVAHMALVAGLETQFDCMLDMDDVLDMSSYDKVVEIMGKYA